MKKLNFKTIIATSLAIVAMSATVVTGASNTYTYSKAFTITPETAWASAAKNFEKATHTMSVGFQKVYAKGNAEYGISRKVIGSYWFIASCELPVTTSSAGMEYTCNMGEISKGTRYYKFTGDDYANYRVEYFKDQW